MIVGPSYTPQSARGFFVVEGVNGAGKGTLLASLAAALRESAVETILTREPGGTPLGLNLRKLLLESKELAIASRSELFLFAADRAEHIAKIIEPSLAAGKVVLSDRYHYSTTAFQGYGRQLPLDEVHAVNRLAAGHCPPDLVLLLDLDPAEGLRRTKARTHSGKDAFEDEALAFHRRIREGFLDQARSLPEPFYIIDASAPPAQVLEQSVHIVHRVLEARVGR